MGELSKNLYARLMKMLGIKKKKSEVQAIIASKNRWNITKCMWKTMLGNLGCLLFLIFLSMITSKILVLFAISIIFTIGMASVCVNDILNCILLIDDKDIKTIKKARCYQDILNDIKKLNLDEIKSIEMSWSSIMVEDFKNNITEYKYESYNFPPLPTEKEGIFLGSLIYDLGLNKKLLISKKGRLMAENLKLIKKMEKEEKKYKERKINKGETW